MAAIGAHVSAPQSMEDVMTLIQALYAPNMPANVYADIQSHLIPLQRNAEGWQLADYLLQQDDPNVKFFGVNTYIVKMNSDWDALDETSVQQLEANLVRWFINLSRQQNSPRHVVMKLSTALALYYAIGKDVRADDAVKTLVCSSLRGEYLDRKQIEMYTTSNLASMLDNNQISLVLQFISDFAAEGQKLLSGYTADVRSTCISRMSANLEDAVLVVQTPLFSVQTAAVSSDAASLCNSAMSSFHALANFAMAAWTRESESIDLLRTLIEPSLVWCANSVDLDGVSILCELLENNRAFFRPSHMELLSKLLDSPWADDKMNQILQADPDAEPFIFLLVAFGQAMLVHLVSNVQNQAVSRFLGKMHAALTVCNNPGIDEEAGPREVLPFWADYVDQVSEKLFDQDAEDVNNGSLPWLAASKPYILQVTDTLFQKIQAPAPEILRTLDSASVDVFKDFRRDVQDLWQEVFRLIGDAFLETTLQRCIAAFNVPEPDWAAVESALYCLNGLADEINPSSDSRLDQLFGLPLFTALSQARLPQWTCRTALETVSQFSSYFQRHSAQLPAIFEFLFVCLQSPAFAHPAANSIYNLCDSCRSTLHPHVGRLVETYQNFLTWPTSHANAYAKEKFIGAIGCVVQSLGSKQEQAQGLLQLLANVQRDVDEGIALLSTSSSLQATNPEDATAAAEMSQVKVMEALSSLRGVGKAMQAPNDEEHTVNLEEDDTPSALFWVTGEGAVVQQQILAQLSEILKHHNNSGELVELACDVLRTGFPESEPGPFVFPAQLVVQFTSMARLGSPGVMSILNMMQALPRAYMSPRIDAALTAMLQHVLSIVRQLGDPRNEPEVTESLLRIVENYMPRYTDVLLQLASEDVAVMFSFAGAALVIPEPLPKRAAASLWESLLSQPSTDPLNALVAHYAPALASALITQICIDALRSDLECLTKLLFRFMKRVTNAKAIMEQALASVSISNEEGLRADGRRLFIAQLAMVKNFGKMREVVTGVWARCRGIPDYA